MMLSELRQELEEIPLLKNIKDQKKEIKNLLSKFDHTIIAKCSGNLISEEFGSYNCFAYALNLVGSGGYLKIASAPPRDVYADSEFIEFLLNNERLLRTHDDIDINEGIILYFDNQKPVHAGKITNKRVTSKWGTALLFEHKIFEVPISYGNRYIVCKNISQADATDFFYDFAETKGWGFKIEE